MSLIELDENLQRVFLSEKDEQTEIVTDGAKKYSTTLIYCHIINVTSPVTITKQVIKWNGEKT